MQFLIFYSHMDIYIENIFRIMSLYLKLFENHNQYTAYTASTEFIKPNVSHCIQEVEVHYNPINYAEDYLTFIAREQGTFTLTIGSAVTTSILESISYSLDNGENWTTTNNVNSQTVTITTPTVEQGDRVLWKGSGVGVSTTTNNSNRPSTSSIFSSTGEFDIEGNILSLVWGDDFADKDYVADGSSYNFALLFYANTAHVGSDYAKVVSAKNMCLPIKDVPTCCYFRMFQETQYGTPETNILTESPRCIAADSVGASACTSMFRHCTSLTTAPELPATTLKGSCYNSMFYGCTALTTAPTLPATTLADNCYAYMFQDCTLLTTVPSILPAMTLAASAYTYMFFGCTSLTTAPELPATTLATYCYYYMFYGCTSLTTAPELPATTLANQCYLNMFAGCASLTTAPELPATTLAQSCYNGMFNGCTSLTTAPVLSATTLAASCYQSMFYDCTSLTTAPELPATTLTNNCYSSMFKGCTSLTTAPVLSATTLTNYCYAGMFAGCTSLTTAPVLSATTLTSWCYYEMFKGCTSLNYIKAMFTTTPSTTYTSNWVSGVAASGTFVKNSAAEWDVTGVHGIPIGWTVETASA